jgi:hypothetical protein
MDLISREAAIEEVDDTVTSVSVCATVEQARGATWAKKRVRERLEKMPNIEAVPMEPLCKLLHDIAYTPCYTTPGLEMCGALCGECDTTCGDEECWMRFLKKWMEGLDDHRWTD